jgi:hypothetical protein
LLRHPTKTLHNLASDFLGRAKKRKRANPKGWMKDLGGLWLENSFGWQPLLNDISDAYKAYKRFTTPVHTVKISAGAKKRWDLSSTLSGFGKTGATAQLDQGCYFRNRRSVYFESHIVRYKGALRARLDCPQWGDTSLFGFNPKEFIPAAWELLPWSFLVDYFTNIGDILDASITSERDLDYVNVSQIKFTELNRILELAPDLVPFAPPNNWTATSWSGSPVTYATSRKDVTRLANVGLSMPTLQFNFSLSDGQLGNCAALLAQANDLHPQSPPKRWHR